MIAIVTDVDLGFSNIVPNDGGYPVRLSGVPAGTFIIHVGPAGDVTDPIAYSGISGQGQNIIVGADGVANLISPMLGPGGPYAFHLVRKEGDGNATETSSALLNVVPHCFRNRTFTLRQLFNPIYDVGSKQLSQVDYPQI